MARVYYKNAEGDYIRNDEDAYMTGEPEDCCCECDCETDGPTASLSYEKTGEPCEFTFTDTSTAGECGEIVSRSWKVNGVEQGTGATFEYDFEEDDAVTLTVTDSAGCEATTGISIVCDDCCEEEGGPPTADFSYTQVDDDPCLINLHDESTAGSCGAIVAWAWFLNADAEPFSTDQNPTNVEVTSGDDITLVVTDAAGCEDDATMEIVCESPDALCCNCFPASLPATVSITVSGFRDFAGIDDCFEALDRTFADIPLIDAGESPCQWQKVFTVPYLDDVTVTVAPGGLGTIEALISVNDFPATVRWSAPCPSGPDCSTASINCGTPVGGEVTGGMSTLCGMPAGWTPQPTCVINW